LHETTYRNGALKNGHCIYGKTALAWKIAFVGTKEERLIANPCSTARIDNIVEYAEHIADCGGRIQEHNIARDCERRQLQEISVFVYFAGAEIRSATGGGKAQDRHRKQEATGENERTGRMTIEAANNHGPR